MVMDRFLSATSENGHSRLQILEINEHDLVAWDALSVVLQVTKSIAVHSRIPIAANGSQCRLQDFKSV